MKFRNKAINEISERVVVVYEFRQQSY